MPLFIHAEFFNKSLAKPQLKSGVDVNYFACWCGIDNTYMFKKFSKIIESVYHGIKTLKNTKNHLNICLIFHWAINGPPGIFQWWYKKKMRYRSVFHYNDVIMGAIASQITSLESVYSAVLLGADQRKYQSSASLAFVRGIHRRPVNSPHKGPVTRKMFPLDDVIMYSWFILFEQTKYQHTDKK